MPDFFYFWSEEIGKRVSLSWSCVFLHSVSCTFIFSFSFYKLQSGDILYLLPNTFADRTDFDCPRWELVFWKSWTEEESTIQKTQHFLEQVKGEDFQTHVGQREEKPKSCEAQQGLCSQERRHFPCHSYSSFLLSPAIKYLDANDKYWWMLLPWGGRRKVLLLDCPVLLISNIRYILVSVQECNSQTAFYISSGIW